MTPEERAQNLRRRQLAARLKAAQESGGATPAGNGSRGVFSDGGVASQAASGFNQGLAAFVGMPIDAAATIINSLFSRPNIQGETVIGEDGRPQFNVSNIGTDQIVSDPVGGAASLNRLIDPVVTDQTPQTAGERFSRRAGQEVGFGVPAAATMALTGPYASAARSNLPGYFAANTASDLAAGVAGQTSREIAPESGAMDAIVSILAGGGTSATIAGASRARPPAPSTQQLWDESKRLSEGVASSGAQITPQSQQRLIQELTDALTTRRTSPRRHPSAYSVLDDLKTQPHATLTDVDDTRHVIGRDVASRPEEAGVGVAMKDAVDSYLNSLTKNDMAGGDPSGLIQDLQRKRQLAHSANKAQTVEGKQYRGTTRAATSGTGGNEVNAQKQNIRSILDNEVAPARSGKRSGYTPDEIAQMERVVFGTKGQNLARWMGRFSPSSGMLPGSMGIAGFGAAAAGTATNPLFALAAVPPSVGYIAKGIAEHGTKKEIAELLDIIRRGGTKMPKKVPDSIKAAIAAQLLSSSDAIAP